ncbi:MAG: helix-turn-helix domain-containing protein [Desulfatirhabdiaceae bacterium]
MIKWIQNDTDGNKTRAAEISGIGRVSLWRNMKRHHMVQKLFPKRYTFHFYRLLPLFFPCADGESALRPGN